MNVPIKLSDFFGKLSISHSPFSWAVWFCYFSALLVIEDSAVSEVFLFVVGVVLIYCVIKAAIDSEEVQYEDFRAERRFIAGSGLGSLLLGSGVALIESKAIETVILVSVPAVIMGIVFMLIAVRIPHRFGLIHNSPKRI